jgi:hypothetical protein
MRAETACLTLVASLSSVACVGMEAAPPVIAEVSALGCSPDGWLDNPALNDCREETSPPCARADAAFVPLPDGDMLMIGGGTGVCFSGSTTEVDRLSPGACGGTASAWSPAASLPAPRGGVAAGWLPTLGKVLVAGGRDTAIGWDEPGGGLQATAWLFDPSSGWTAAAGLPIGHFVVGAKHESAVLADGSFLFYGSRASDSAVAIKNAWDSRNAYFDTTHSHRYYPATNTWVSMEMHEGRHYGDQAVLSDGRVVVAGGRAVIPSDAQFPFRNTIEVFHPETNAWTLSERRLPAVSGEDAPPFPPGVAPDPDGGRMALALAALPDGKVLLAGGLYREPPWACRNPKTLMMTDPCVGNVCSDGNLCRSCPDGGKCTAGLCADGVTSCQNANLPFGRSLLSRSVLVYDPATDTLEPATPLPEPRAAHQMIPISGSDILLVGGMDGMTDTPTTLIFHYTGDAGAGYGSWTSGPRLPGTPRSAGETSYVRSSQALQLVELSDGSLFLGDGFDSTVNGCNKPSGHTYLLPAD